MDHSSSLLGDALLGEDSRGKLYLEDSDDEEEDDHHRHRGHMGGSLERHMSIDEESMDGDVTAVSSESDDEDGTLYFKKMKLQMLIHTIFYEIEWIREVNQTLERAWQDNHTVDIAALELNTLKMAFNISFHDLRAISIPFFVQRLDMAKLAVCMKEVSLSSLFLWSYI
jgi:translation initiation factor eIF-2B subunit epsilon